MEAVALGDARAARRPAPSGRAIAGVVLLAICTVLITWRARVLERTLEREGEQPALVSQAAPDFSAQGLDGQPVSLADFRGKKNVVVSFWASWCGPCRMEMPALVKFYKDHHTADSDFEFLAVSIDDDTKAASDFATAQQLNFPVVLDPRQKVADAYEVDGIPTMFVIDKEGKIKYGHAGYDLAMEYRLVHELGLEKKDKEEAADGNTSH
jgi:peroxiredoxin